MTDFTNLAALIAQGQSLLDLVKGGHITQLEADNAAKLGEVDAALAAKIAQANSAVANAVAPIDGKVPHMLLTQNSRLTVTTGTIPDGVTASASATFSVLNRIHQMPEMRDASQNNLLAEIEVNIKEQFADFDVRAEEFYFDSFNIIQIDWDFGAEFSGNEYVMNLGLLTDGGHINRVLAPNEKTAQALIKLTSGELMEHDIAKGAVLGKWRYCNHQTAFSNKVFGKYGYSYLGVKSQTGSLLIALPSIVTGLVSHPKEIHF